jgi:hypothetical protein
VTVDKGASHGKTDPYTSIYRACAYIESILQGCGRSNGRRAVDQQKENEEDGLQDKGHDRRLVKGIHPPPKHLHPAQSTPQGGNKKKGGGEGRQAEAGGENTMRIPTDSPEGRFGFLALAPLDTLTSVCRRFTASGTLSSIASRLASRIEPGAGVYPIGYISGCTICFTPRPGLPALVGCLGASICTWCLPSGPRVCSMATSITAPATSPRFLSP